MKENIGRRKFKKSEEGLATLEALPLMTIFVILIGYGLGMWGYVHSGILNSIAARTYAFETFRNRTDLTYFRVNDSVDATKHYDNIQTRWHGIMSANSRIDGEIYAPKRRIAFGLDIERKPASSQVHNEGIHKLDPRNRVKVSPAWLMVGYGICIDFRCGGN